MAAVHVYTPDAIMGFKPPTLNLSLVPPPAGGGVVGGGWAKAAARPAQPSAADMQQGQGLIKVDSGKTVYSLKFFNLIRSAPTCVQPVPRFPQDQIRRAVPATGPPGPAVVGGGGGRGRGGGNKPTGKRVIALPPKEKIVLQTSENAWKPNQVDTTADDKLFLRITGILNKMTDKTFEKLTAELLSLGIDSQKRLDGLISFIFNKALDQEFFSGLYACLCRKLKHITVPKAKAPDAPDDAAPEMEKFSSALLRMCEQRFSSVTSASEDAAKLEAKAEDDNVDQQELDLRKAKAKRHLLGYMRFIGELYKQNLASAGVMAVCMNELLDGEPDEQKIECSVKLLITVGSGLEVDKKAEMDEWFKVLDRVQKQRVARIRFMIQNLQQVRASGWRNNEREGLTAKIGKATAEAGKKNARLRGGQARLNLQPARARGGGHTAPKRPVQLQIQQRSEQRDVAPSGVAHEQSTDDKEQRGSTLAAVPPSPVLGRAASAESGEATRTVSPGSFTTSTSAHTEATSPSSETPNLAATPDREGEVEDEGADDGDYNDAGDDADMDEDEERDQFPGGVVEADRAKIAKMAKDTLADYFAQDGKMLEAAVAEVREIHDTRVFIHEMLLVWLELVKPAQIEMLKVLATALGSHGLIISRDYDDVIKTQVEFLLDLAIDVPLAPKRYAECIACGVACGAASLGVLTHQEFEPFGAGPWARLVCNVLKQIGAGVEQAKAKIAEDSVDLVAAAKKFGMDEADFRQVLGDNGLADVL